MYHPEKAWLTVSEAAALAECTPKTIRNYIHAGHLKAKRRGPRTLVISIDDFSALYRPYVSSKLRRFQ